MEAAPLPPAGEGGAKRRVRARRSRCGESVAALTTGAPGANALGGKCPPASACGRRLLLDLAPKGIRTHVHSCTAAHKRTTGCPGFPACLRPQARGDLPVSGDVSRGRLTPQAGVGGLATNSLKVPPDPASPPTE